MEKQVTTIKEIITDAYAISLVQTGKDIYHILYATPETYAAGRSEGVRDYSMASYLFDIKLFELSNKLQ